MNILILVDENIPQMTVAALGSMGHDVLDIRGAEREGISDDVIWELAQREGRLLITTDKAFAQYRNESHYGVLIVRLRQPNRSKIHTRVLQAISQFGLEEWPGLLVIMRDEVQSIWRSR
jgi:predicted nuclease of predicted toxin-antitoxin system